VGERIEGFSHPSFRHLADVPPGPLSPEDPDRFEKWRLRQQYAEDMRLYRLQVLADVTDNKRLEHVEREKCSHDPAYFISVYGYIVEPRKRKSGSGLGGSGTKPWVLVERQVQMLRWIDWVQQQEDENADGLVSKARDWGASWLTVADSVHRWIFEEPFSSLFLSASEEFVDSKSPKSLFTKMDKFIEYLPTFLKPPGFAPTRHRFHRYLLNPANGNTITGETTTTRSGRSDRVSRVFIDEAAQVPDLEYVYAGLTDVTDHRIMVSTESMDQGPFFYDMRTGANVEERCAVFEADWWQLQDDDWYARAQARYSAMPNGADHFQREIMRDPHTQSDFCYPTLRHKIPDVTITRDPGAPLYVTIDPGFNDACAIIIVQKNLASGKYEVLDGYTNSNQEAAFYGPLLTGERVDVNGVPIAGDWQYGEEEDRWIDQMKAWGGKSAVTRYIGDTYGENKSGASADSWYSVWRRNHQIAINIDRMPSGKLASYRMQARTHVGRRKSMRWWIPMVEFADTLGARKVLFAWQNNKFPKAMRSGRIPESGMLRDSTTHFTSAGEFLAANLDMQNQLLQYSRERQSRQELEELAEGPTGHRFGRRMAEMR
jgi:hypothetical protein